MDINPTPLRDLMILQPKVHGDERGFFIETWNAETLAAQGLSIDFVQDNHSRSSCGTLRGLHYQSRRPQGKLVRCTRGQVYDVAVDLRRDSPSFGQWFGCTLSEQNFTMLWVPPGFAHGFYVVSEVAEFQYKCSEGYDPESEVSLSWDDPSLAIDWQIPPGEAPSLSAKDANGLLFQQAPLF
ncbi:MAG: dTDP-4-dehydrorhamnose 3,5-epimerase [Halieaceae bacterium]|jgi:dTDP-4-dehydrorhamnose 3,5-epimerase